VQWLFTGVVIIHFIIYINNLESLITILRNIKLKIIYNYNKEGCYSYKLKPKTIKLKPYRVLKNLRIIKKLIIIENSLSFSYKTKQSISIIILKDV
jgi:hypothetical protein